MRNASPNKTGVVPGTKTSRSTSATSAAPGKSQPSPCAKVVNGVPTVGPAGENQKCDDTTLDLEQQFVEFGLDTRAEHDEQTTNHVANEEKLAAKASENQNRDDTIMDLEEECFNIGLGTRPEPDESATDHVANEEELAAKAAQEAWEELRDIACLGDRQVGEDMNSIALDA